MRRILSSILTLLILVTLLIFSANSFAQQVPFANVPFDTANIPEPVPPPAAVRDFFQLDPYYQQWISVRGFPVLASVEVSPYALKESAWLIWKMVGHRPAILRTMAEKRARYVIVPHNKHTSDMPESNTGRLSFFWDVRKRDVHCRDCPIASDTEEALLNKSSAPIHHLGHLLQDRWMGWDGSSTLNNRVIAFYNMAKAEGLYQNRYAGSTAAEYWAEGVGSWFNITHPNNVAPTRSALKKYDPRFANLLTEVFGDGDWRYTPPATRTHLPHLQGFDPQEAPIYQRPARLLKLDAQLRNPNSDGDGKWVNLKLHDPSELPRLLNLAPRNNHNRTDFIFGNLTGTDLTLYSFDSDEKKSLRYYSTTDDFTAFDTHVGAIWLIQDHTGKDLVVFRAEEQVGRVLIGGPPSQSVLDVNSDGTVDLLDLTPIASRYGRRGANQADINKDGIVNILDVLLVAGSVSALPRQVVKTFKATTVQRWLTDANKLRSENENLKKGIVVLEHLLTEIEFLSTPMEVIGQSEAIFPGHTDIGSVAFSSDGQTLASSGWDDKIRLSNAETKQHEITLIEQAGIKTVAFSPDGQTLASGNWDAAVRLWDPSTGEVKRTLIGHTDGIESVVFSPDGATLASGSADGTIRLWNPSIGTLKRTLRGQGRMRSVAFSPDGKTLASGSSDHTIQLWNPDTGKLKRTLIGHTDWVEGVVFSPDGNTLASGGGGSERTLRLWNLHNGQEKKKFTGYTAVVSGIAFSPDGQLLASGGWGTKIRLWNTKTGKDENALEGHTGGVISVAFSPDGRMLISGGDDRTVRLWKVSTGIDIRKSVIVVQVKASERPPMYWIDTAAGTLHRLIGTEVENLAQNVQNAASLAVDMAGDKLYWTERTSGTTGKIRRANLDGTNVQLVKGLTSVPLDIALDAVNGKLYIANAWGKVQRMNVDGSNFQPNLITGLDMPRNLVLDVAGGKVYWTEATEAFGRIRRANLDGSGIQDIATGLTELTNLAVANGKIYWTSSRKLQRANLNGTNRKLLETLPSAPTRIAVDTARDLLYLTLPTGEIQRRNLDGLGDQPIVTGLVAPSNIVLGIMATTPGPIDAPEPPATSTVDAATDVNKDKKVNKTDLLLVVTALGENPPANPSFDVNADGAVNIADVLLVIEALDDPVAAAAPSFGETITALDPAQLAMQLDILRAESDGSLKYEHAIAFFQGLLASIRPTETQLFANYPNPFNPETWIPYQLSKPSEVSISIHSAAGKLVRRLELGVLSAGVYHSKSRAAYWDGCNELGESVASGVYFYTLTAGDFTATRKMLIRK